VLVDTASGAFVVKLRGAAQGVLPLIAEVIAGGIASVLGLPVPERAVVELDASVPTDDGRDELLDVIGASHGPNLGLRYLDKATVVRQDQLHLVSADLAARVLWLDGLILNPDRTRANPNLLISERRPWLIDHGATLSFHFDWRSVTEQSPREPGPDARRHLLADRAQRAHDIDSSMADLLTRDRLEAILESVPSSFLDAAYPGEAAGRVRARYHAFIWKRSRAPRPFWSTR
jgi:hypothetical protein